MNTGRLKPLVRALCVRPVQFRQHVSLSRPFEESFFRSAQVLSEGYCGLQNDGSYQDEETIYTGSTMLTVDLHRMGSSVMTEVERLGLATLVRVVEGSVRIRIRSIRLALSEATRRCVQGELGTAHIETRVRLEGNLLHVDVDLEAPVLQSAIKQRKG